MNMIRADEHRFAVGGKKKDEVQIRRRAEGLRRSEEKIDLLGHVTILHITARRHILRRGPRQVSRPNLGRPGDQRFHKPKSAESHR